MTGQHYGARPQDWRRLIELGLLRDLLPVVSNPNARISADSKLKQVGKVPSRYVNRDEVAGIPNWTSRQTTHDNAAHWQRETDYGICLQTRRVRALDVDVEDLVEAKIVEVRIRELLAEIGVTKCPVRFRADSGKHLFAFILEGDWFKRILRVDGGMVEFLADGQQFIAFGTHPKGQRYEWRNFPEPLVDEQFPALTSEQFEHLWLTLEKEFGIEKSIEVRTAERRAPRLPPTESDAVAVWLDQNGWVISTQRDGRLNITCPFEDEHTSESNETATQYFPAGTGGFALGHFRCLHAHCAGRSDADYKREIGYTAELFDVVAVVDNPQQADEPWPVFARNDNGRMLATVGNVVRACGHSGFLGFEIRHDTFRDEIMLRDITAGPHAWRAFTDSDYVTLRLSLERRGFLPVGRDLIRDAVLATADEHKFDSAVAWLESLPPWDGVERVDSFLPVYAASPDNDYTRAVSRYMWTAMAGRVLAPGCQVDMVPILVGNQGVGKTTLVREIAPAPDFFMEAALDAHDDQLARRMRGKLVAEIGELRGLRSREIEAIKSFITRTHEQWVPKWREFATTYPRRLLFIGTTNEESFLADETGNRRWLPVRVTAGDTVALRRDRLQLWAEAAVLWRREGVAWRAAHESADSARLDHSVHDDWGPAVGQWLRAAMEGVPAPGSLPDGVTSADVLVGALGFELKHIKRGDEMRLGGVMRSLGYEKQRRMIEGQRHMRWVRVEG